MVAALAMTIASAAAFDKSRYPDWSGQWGGRRGRVPMGPDQAARPRAAGAADAGVSGRAARRASPTRRRAVRAATRSYTCISNGMPRMMTVAWPIEFVVLPNITYVHFEVFMPRRIYTDGREFPAKDEPELRGLFDRQMARHRRRRPLRHARSRDPQFQGPAHLRSRAAFLHNDNQSVIRERIFLDKADHDILHDEITTFDHALTRPWTVDKTLSPRAQAVLVRGQLHREQSPCGRRQGDYFVGADGYLMPAAKGPGAAGFALFQAAEVTRAPARAALVCDDGVERLADLPLPACGYRIHTSLQGYGSTSPRARGEVGSRSDPGEGACRRV